MMWPVSREKETGDAGPSRVFLQELARLIAASGKPPTEIAAAAGLPVSVIAGSLAGIIRVPASRLVPLAAALNVDVVPLARLWAVDHAPWLLELLHAAEVRGAGSAGGQP